jgi:hypothetical protein
MMCGQNQPHVDRIPGKNKFRPGWVSTEILRFLEFRRRCIFFELFFSSYFYLFLFWT